MTIPPAMTTRQNAMQGRDMGTSRNLLRSGSPLPLMGRVRRERYRFG